MREFDRNFCQQLAQSTEQLAALQQKLDSEAVKLPSENVETAADKETPVESVGSFGEEDSVIISKPADKTINETFNNTALNDESHVTYITQNMSTFLANNTCLQDPDSSRVDFPKFGSIPQLPSAIVLEGSPRPKSPSVKSKSSDVQSDLSVLSSLEISECVTRDKRRASSTSSVTTRNTGSTGSISTFTNHPISETPIVTGCTSTLTSLNCEQFIKSPPKVNRVVTPDVSAAELESCGRLSADSTLPRELAQLSHWIGKFGEY